MRITASAVQLLLSALFTFSSHAQTIVDDLSFGQKGAISPDGRTIPGWSILGEGHTPHVLSDRVVLTPPYPGNKRGALWTTHGSGLEEWTADMKFRASGQERGSGNLQIWYTKEDEHGAGLSSAYTVGKFDGLVLVLDQYGGSGGSVRGFLNDVGQKSMFEEPSLTPRKGSINFKERPNIDSLAFGHCQFSYRNLGKFAQLRMKQSANSFAVEVDGRPCFSTDKVKLPSSYYFGISVASAENPDSFEINSFIVSSSTRQSSQPASAAQQQQQARQVDRDRVNVQTHEAYSESHNQGLDILNRLQANTQQVNNIYRELQALAKKIDDKHSELITIQAQSAPYGQIHDIDRRLRDMEVTLRRIQNEVEAHKDYKEHLTGLQDALQNALPDRMAQSKLAHLSKNSITGDHI